MANGFKTGGREKGTPNKITSQVREMITEFVNSEFEKLQQDFNTLTPQEKWKILIDLLPFVVPKQKTISAEIDGLVPIGEIRVIIPGENEM